MSSFFDEIAAKLAQLSGVATPEVSRDELNEFNVRDIQAVRVSEGGGGGGGNVPFVGVDPPDSPTDGMLWWDPDDDTPVPGSLSGALCSADLLFTEQATAGTYTATLDVLAGSVVSDVLVYLLGWPWALDPNNDMLALTVGDSTVPNGFIDNSNLLNFSAAQYDPENPDFSSWFMEGGTIGGNFRTTAYGSDPNGQGAAGPGIRYPTDDTITATIVTTITSPPVTPSGILLVKILYFAPATVTDAVFA